jgi:Carbohydrate binding module (family 6)/Domain of unknown function (DUF4832)
MMKKSKQPKRAPICALITSCLLAATSYGAGVGDTVLAASFNEEIAPTNTGDILVNNGVVHNAHTGSWVKFDAFNFGNGVFSCTFEASNGAGNTSVSVYAGGRNPVNYVGTVQIPATGSWNIFRTFTATHLNNTFTGVQDLYLVYGGSCNIKTLQLNMGLGSTLKAAEFSSESHENNDSIIKKEGSIPDTNIGFIAPGSWIKYKNFNFGTGASTCTVSGSSWGWGTVKVCVQKDNISTNPMVMVGSVGIGNTGGWNNYQNFSSDAMNTTITGIHDIILVFDGSFNLRSFKTEGLEVGCKLNAVDYDDESHPNNEVVVSKVSSNVTNLASGSWIKYGDFRFGAGSLSFSVNASRSSVSLPAGAGVLKLYLDDPNPTLGKLIGSVNIGVTGLGVFQNFNTSIGVAATGVRDLFFVFTEGYEIKSFRFDPKGQELNWAQLTHSPDQPGLEQNPLKGFTTLWDISNSFPCRLRGKNFLFGNIMTGVDTFDWTAVDAFINAEAAAGRHTFFQCNIDDGDDSQPFSLPTYLSNVVRGTYTSSNGQTIKTLDWNNEVLMTAMIKFITKLGEKYKNNDKIFMITQGIYGRWGEWHTGGHAATVMTLANRTRLANAFSTAFSGTKKILARYPSAMPNSKKFGYSDGAFFWWSINPSNGVAFYNLLKNGGAGNNWQSYPMGGEIAVEDVTGIPIFQKVLWQNWPNTVGEDVVDCLNLTRPTFLISGHLLGASNQPGTEWDNALKAAKMMGYNFFLKEYKLTATAGIPTVKVNIQNKGVAPIYANWQVELGVHVNGQVTRLGTAQWNLSTILPGDVNNFRTFNGTAPLANGTHTILLRVVNPLGNSWPLRFANTTQDAGNQIGWLTLGNMTITGGVAN